jgi:hypothetical protein
MKTIITFDNHNGSTNSMTIENDEDGRVDIPQVWVKMDLIIDECGEPGFQVSFPGQFVKQSEVRDGLIKILRKLGAN